METDTSKGPYGWCAERHIEEGDKVWIVTTMKRFSGHVTTRADLNRKEKNMLVYTMDDPTKSIDHGKVRATKKSIQELHEKAIKELF